MAEIITSTGNKKGIRRNKKLNTRVDLTPMVDLGFLLITFFIITTTWSDAKSLKVFMPADGKGSKVSEKAVLTLVPLPQGVLYYEGDMNAAINSMTFGMAGYSVSDGIGSIIRKKQADMDNRKSGSSRELTILIKPSSTSNYKNVISILNEIVINDVKRYALMDAVKEEEVIAANMSSDK